MGIPLITRRSAACDELLVENRHCLMVDEGNPEQLARQIRHARENYAAVCEMADRGQQLFASVCSPEATGKTIFREMEKVLARNRRKQPADAANRHHHPSAGSASRTSA